MKQYKPRDKVTQKITREGAVEENQTTGKSENISGKEKEADFSGRLHFTEEDRAMPELDRYIRKAEQAADKAEAARERIPKKKKLTRERLYDEAKSKGKTKLRFKEVEKPMSEVEKTNPVSRPASLAGRMITGKAHGKIHEVEKENSGVEAGHSIERTGERALSKSSGMAKTALRNHRLKPYREAAKAERALHKANVNFWQSSRKNRAGGRRRYKENRPGRRKRSPFYCKALERGAPGSGDRASYPGPGRRHFLLHQYGDRRPGCCHRHLLPIRRTGYERGGGGLHRYGTGFTV